MNWYVVGESARQYWRVSGSVWKNCFMGVVLSGGGERLDEGIKRDGGNGNGLRGGRITDKSTVREVKRGIVKRTRLSIKSFYNVRVAAELFHTVQNGEIRSFNSTTFIQTVFFCHIIPGADGDRIARLKSVRVRRHRLSTTLK